jgi:hypothetical protein
VEAATAGVPRNITRFFFSPPVPGLHCSLPMVWVFIHLLLPLLKTNCKDLLQSKEDIELDAILKQIEKTWCVQMEDGSELNGIGRIYKGRNIIHPMNHQTIIQKMICFFL